LLLNNKNSRNNKALIKSITTLDFNKIIYLELISNLIKLKKTKLIFWNIEYYLYKKISIKVL
jgi:hypothetical protein